MTPHPSGFEGIIVYTIHKDGCLTGLYATTGNGTSPTYVEIARKTANIPPPANTTNTTHAIVGIYICSWIDGNNNTINGTLRIDHLAANGSYPVSWQEGAGNTFIGIGFLIGNNMFAVNYTTV